VFAGNKAVLLGEMDADLDAGWPPTGTASITAPCAGTTNKGVVDVPHAAAVPAPVTQCNATEAARLAPSGNTYELAAIAGATETIPSHNATHAHRMITSQFVSTSRTVYR
jgi:hypothetical protein